MSYVARMSVHVIIGSKFDDDDDVDNMVLCMLYIKCLDLDCQF